MGRDSSVEKDKDRRRRDRSRSRSRDRDRDRRRKDKDKDRDRSRDRDRKKRSASPEQRKAPKPPRSPSPDPEVARQKTEIDDLTKDQRTVFVSQLVMKATERQIRSFFEKIGKVKDVIMIRDKYTNRHKGFAYVEMTDLEAVPMVLMLNGTVADFQRFPILVKASEAEKNFLAKQEASAAQLEAADINRDLVRQPPPRRRLVVGNLHPNITEADLRTVLAPFGDVEAVDMVCDQGASVGRAVVTFADAGDALKASTRIAGIELGADRPITVDFLEDAPIPPPPPPPPPMMNSFGGATGAFGLDAGQEGLAMDAAQRASLMQQLGQRAVPPPPQQAPPLSGNATAAFVITNMFDPATETEPNWRQDIHDDVTLECGKYGEVLHAHVDGHSPRGLVHVLFRDAAASHGAASAMHGRWFAGRLITVSFVDERAYHAQFADAA